MTPIAVPDPSADLPAGMDFYRLRREGIGHIAEAGGNLWTDYNTHDPGITILEGLAYAITDLSYRSRFPMADQLISADQSPGDPYQDQVFPTAREILTVNPVTPTDFRRLLIDADDIRNAWVRCRPCGCETSFVSWCEAGELTTSWDPGKRRDQDTPVHPVEPRGLYEVLLDLEADPVLGELNDATIVRRYRVTDKDGKTNPVTVELRFPEWPASRREERDAFVRGVTEPGTVYTEIESVKPGPLTRTETGTAQVDDDELRRHWNDIFVLDLEITLPDKTTITIDNVTVRLYGGNSGRRAVTVSNILSWAEDVTAEGFAETYRAKLAATGTAINAAKALLHAHRNLDEDWDCIRTAAIAEIGVCADIEVDPAADIELVQARVWLAIEHYLSPPVRFASLNELAAAGVSTDEIFTGPELSNGFLTDDVLRQTDLRTQLRTSDLVNLLIDIDGVSAVSGLLLTAYDPRGIAMAGIADPTWQDTAGGGVPIAVFDPNRTSAAWLIVLPPDHRARLHRGLSRFAFIKDGLPFVPRTDEAEATLVQLRGAAARPKLRGSDLDRSLPVGVRRDLAAYQPVQHNFPATYGIGPEGLSSGATPERRAQAKQLKAYLMVYEQLLLNTHAQLAHAPDLFSLGDAVYATYFAGDLTSASIAGYDEIVDDSPQGSLRDAVRRLVESPAEFVERRNRFLDHLLARFGESLGGYGLTPVDGESEPGDLIRDKISFLKSLPRLGHDRGKAFNRTELWTKPGNSAGLQQRVHLLLGLPDLLPDVSGTRTDSPPAGTTDEVTSSILIEHLLLRPKFPGDALYPVCGDGPCCGGGCGDDDPYSFRLTLVMPGWSAPYSTDMTMRRFAERTIREQTPSHLLVKICWVDRQQYEKLESAWSAWITADAAIDWTEEKLLDAVVELLTAGATAPGVTRADVCACAKRILTEHGIAFRDWMDQGLRSGLELKDFGPFGPPTPTPCASLGADHTVGPAIGDLLGSRYAVYHEVCYRLSLLNDALSALRSTYPQATLHDCDDGSDFNPVRLDHTALGSN